MPIRYTQRFTEGVLYETGIPPANHGIAVHNTPWVDMSDFHRAVAELSTGVMAQGATLDMALQQATDNAGAGVKAIIAKGGGAKAINQLTQAGGNGNDRVVIELQSEELDVTNRFRWVRAQITIAGAAVFFDAQIKRFQAGHSPVSVAALTEVID